MKRYYQYVNTMVYGTLYITKNKIYEILEYIPDMDGDRDLITIIADTGKVLNLFIKVGDTVIFEEVTHKVRNKVIDGILK